MPGYLRIMEFANDQSSSVREQNPIREKGESFGRLEYESEPFGPEVLILHEDSATGMRAEYVLDNVQNQAEIGDRFLISVCSFGMLEDPGLAEAALQQAGRADIVLLSLHGHQKLPTAVRKWLLRWLEFRQFKPCALVASLDSCRRESLKCNPTWKFLRVITAPLEVDLFLHLGEPPLTARCH